MHIFKETKSIPTLVDFYVVKAQLAVGFPNALNESNLSH